MTGLTRALLVLAGMIGGYLAAALMGSLIPVNNDWVEPSDGIAIYVESNGIHAGLVLPVVTAENDWRDLIRPSHFQLPYADAPYYRFGWGSLDFYQNVPDWKDVTPAIALRALFGSGTSAMYVDQAFEPVPGPYVRRLIVTPAQYDSIVRDIRSGFVYDREGLPIALPGPTATDSLYVAHGRYSSFDTCNVWTNRILQRAGIRTGLWTPFQGGVMRWR